MLGKLIKYDLRDILKNVVVLYVIGLLLSISIKICDRLFFNSSFRESFPTLTTVFTATLFTAFFFIIAAINLYTLFRCVRRFYRNVLCQEGYLTNTIPIKKVFIIISNLIASTIVLMLSLMVCFLLILFLQYHDYTVFDSLKNIANGFNKEIGMSIYNFIGIMFITSILSTLSSMSIIYLAFSLGQLSNHNRVLFSILYGILIYIVIQFILLLILLSFSSHLDTLFASWEALSDQVASTRIIYFMCIVSSIINAIITIVCTALTSRILERKLNLE
ncbi:MAG: hypothetical protein LBR40_00240 [Bacilli bacterium]|jgi:hypothetical protein|nr:hypothetical protein [Bacilli bacterium]